MSSSDKVAVQATRRDHYGLKHVPSGDPLDEHGRGEWPRDSFTFRLRDEKAIRLVEDDADAPTPAESRKASGSSAKE